LVNHVGKIIDVCWEMAINKQAGSKRRSAPSIATPAEMIMPLKSDLNINN